jgi:hypothetical protein
MYTKVQEYMSKVREIHGEDYDVRTEPIDAEAIMRLRGGKKHERLWIADGAIDSTTVPSLDAIRARSTSPALQRLDALEVIPVLLIIR